MKMPAIQQLIHHSCHVYKRLIGLDLLGKAVKADAAAGTGFVGWLPLQPQFVVLK